MPTKTAYRLKVATDAMTKLLPPTEAEIMQIIWRDGCATVRHVHRCRTQQRALAYTSTQTTVERLAEKGLLTRGNRQGQGGAYIYAPAVGEQEFVAQRLADILSAIERDYPAALAEYLDARPPA